MFPRDPQQKDVHVLVGLYYGWCPHMQTANGIALLDFPSHPQEVFGAFCSIISNRHLMVKHNSLCDLRWSGFLRGSKGGRLVGSLCCGALPQLPSKYG